MASISNIRKKIRFFILLKIKLGLFQRAFLEFGKYFAFFKNFSVFKLHRYYKWFIKYINNNYIIYVVFILNNKNSIL